MDTTMSGSAYVWCDVCGKKIGEGEAAYVRQRTDEDGEIETLEIDFEHEIWQCKGCRDQWDEQDD